MTHKLLPALMGLVLLCSLGTGCTSDLEKATRVINAGIKKCKEGKDTFVKIEMFDGTKTPVLREACDLPLGKVTIKDKIHAAATQGPYTWRSGISSEGEVWVLAGADWSTMAKAKRIVDSKEPTPDDLVLAEKHLAEIQKAVPNSTWVRKHRFANLLKLRAVERRKSKTPLLDIGKTAQTYLDGLVTWAADKNPDLAAEARLDVITYYKKYKRILESNVETLESSDGDAALETTIADAKKNKDQASVDKYTKELEERRKKRPEAIKQSKARLATLKANMCKELTKLSTNNVKDDKLNKRITAIKGSTKCS